MKICYFLVPKNTPKNLTFGVLFGGPPPPWEGVQKWTPILHDSGVHFGGLKWCKMLQFQGLIFNSVFEWFCTDFGYPLGALFSSKSQKNRLQGRLEAGIKKGSEKGRIFERLEPRKVTPRAGESMILRFCPTPGKNSILEVFSYLLLDLVGSPTVENMVLKGA